MQELLLIMKRLRAPDGCPWDREQTHESLRPYLLEEAAEAVDAVSGGSRLELAGELGDVLLQVAFHSVIAEEEGTFSYAEVERRIVEKLVRRHPHIFGTVAVSDSTEVVRNWQAIKEAEREGRPRTAAERVPAALGALARETQAQKLQNQMGLKRLSGAPEARQAMQQQMQQAEASEEGVAALLAAMVAWARAAGIDPETALRAHTQATLQALPDPS